MQAMNFGFTAYFWTLVASWFLFQACRGSYSKHTIGLLVFINQSKWPEFGQSRQSLWHPIPDPQLLNHCSQLIPILNVLIPELNQQHISCFFLKLGPCGPSCPVRSTFWPFNYTETLCFINLASAMPKYGYTVCLELFGRLQSR
jgi:hypothetical protein